MHYMGEPTSVKPDNHRPNNGISSMRIGLRMANDTSVVQVRSLTLSLSESLNGFIPPPDACIRDNQSRKSPTKHRLGENSHEDQRAKDFS